MKNHNCRRALGSASLPAGLRALAVAASLVLPAAAQDTKTDLPPGVTISVPSEASEEKTLRVNFRGVPLEMVLTELSTAAGYIIVVEPEAKGKLDTKIDVWSSQPVSQEEALTILNAALGRSGCAAIRNGRTLTVVTKEEAKKRDLPVRTGSNPAEIPKNDDMVTQILPVRFINAAQLTKDLQPLISDKATMTANESGNALVITDSQVNIRRFAEIIRALDTSLASASQVKVFALRFADAKQLATVIKELFPAADTGGGRTGGGRRWWGWCCWWWWRRGGWRLMRLVVG